MKEMMKVMIGMMITMVMMGGVIEGSGDKYQYGGFFKTPFSAFTKIDTYRNQKALFITRFGGTPGAINYVPNIAPKLANIASIQSEVIVSGVTWPNEADIIPENIFGPDFLLTAGGFLVPGAQTGEVLIIDVTNKTEYKVSNDERGYFYHLGTWYDVDGDGLQDIVSAKTDFPTFGAGDGKLVWFKNPGKFTFPWKEALLVRGPDVFFRLADINGDGRTEIVASIFVNERLSVFYNNGNFANTNDWKEVVVDRNLGAAFDVRVADLNNDGKVDLLVTNHQSRESESAVFAYDIPADIVNGKYIRYKIGQGFRTTQPGLNQASPGSAQAFYPNLGRTKEKPLVIVSGDGTQQAHLLRSNSESASDWTYTMETIIDVDGTVGGISVGDVDDDGYSDFFVPNYSDGEIHYFTFGPN